MSFENDLCFVYRVEPKHGGERLDRFLAAAASAENLSRTRVKSLIEAGHASIDGAMVIDPSQLLRAGQTVSEAELRAFTREKLAPYKVPAHVEFRAELPKTMVGKVLRRELRDGQT